MRYGIPYYRQNTFLAVHIYTEHFHQSCIVKEIVTFNNKNENKRSKGTKCQRKERIKWALLFNRTEENNGCFLFSFLMNNSNYVPGFKWVGLEEGHRMVSEVLTTLCSGHHLGEGSRCQVPATDSQQGLQVGVDLLQVVEPLVPGKQHFQMLIMSKLDHKLIE